ncbi:MAG TPA: dihydroorotase [Vicinamibacterales bacterium]|jgi:dihydroorotase|nr:dihydroorotase [Vicinamibacterales bacterium]
MKRLLRGGRVVDPANGIDGQFDVLIERGRIAEIGRDLPVTLAEGGEVVEIPAGLVLCPGFIDMHVHLREPGQEHKETVATGVLSAVTGGFTAVACMPNTKPVNDNAGVTQLILQKAREANLARVYPIGAVSRGQKGEELADIAELREAGCVAVTDDGLPISTAILARRALEYTSMFAMPVIEHCEDQTLKGEGVAHEGPVAASLGLKGIPGVAEAITAGRDILLAEMTGGHVHIAHMSAWTTLEAVRQGKSRGVKVTAEVCPHHFTLTDDMLAAPVPYDTNTKMNPPLREARDRDSMLSGIADGSVDVIATDHAPHHYDEKNVEFDRAPFGIVGLETAVPICLDRLVRSGVIRLPRLVELMSVNPARILNLHGGSLATGAVADITVLAPELPVTIDRAALKSKSKNTPYHGWTFTGGVAATIVGGRIVHVGADSGWPTGRD